MLVTILNEDSNFVNAISNVAIMYIQGGWWSTLDLTAEQAIK